VEKIGRVAYGAERVALGSLGVDMLKRSICSRGMRGWCAGPGREVPNGPSRILTTHRGFGILAASRAGRSLGRGQEARHRVLVPGSQVRILPPQPRARRKARLRRGAGR
jgi:hypothetical protein